MSSFHSIKSLAALAVLCVCFFAATGATAAQKDIPGMDSKQLAEYVAANKGKVIVVNIFASWCPPCAKEVPNFIAARKKYAGKDVAIIGVSVDEEIADLRDFIGKYKFNYPLYLGRGDFIRAVGLQAIPHLLLFDREGKLVESHEGYVDAEALTKLLDATL